MNDYKKLIGRLKALGEYLEFDKQSCVYLAADAIEQLVKERDAAMRTMPHDCNTCSKDCNITIAHKALFTQRCDEWEWRGVQEDRANG